MAERRRFSKGEEVETIEFGRLTMLGESGEALGISFFRPGRRGEVLKEESHGTVIVSLDGSGSVSPVRARIKSANLIKAKRPRS